MNDAPVSSQPDRPEYSVDGGKIFVDASGSGAPGRDLLRSLNIQFTPISGEASEMLRGIPLSRIIGGHDVRGMSFATLKSLPVWQALEPILFSSGGLQRPPASAEGSDGQQSDVDRLQALVTQLNAKLETSRLKRGVEELKSLIYRGGIEPERTPDFPVLFPGPSREELRVRFACAAITSSAGSGRFAHDLARDAWEIADAMLAALEEDAKRRNPLVYQTGVPKMPGAQVFDPGMQDRLEKTMPSREAIPPTGQRFTSKGNGQPLMCNWCGFSYGDHGVDCQCPPLATPPESV